MTVKSSSVVPDEREMVHVRVGSTANDADWLQVPLGPEVVTSTLWLPAVKVEPSDTLPEHDTLPWATPSTAPASSSR